MVLALLLAVAPDGGSCGGVACEAFKSERLAFERVLAVRPAILAIGEVHEVGASKVKSAVKRFGDTLLPSLQGRAASLVAETWMLSGKCGEAEQQAAAEVAKTTQRPDTTEDELTAMLGKAYDLGLKNHILLLTCDDYRALLDAQGELDADQTLRMVRRKVEALAEALRDKDEAGVPERMLVLYGGALHNDLAPAAGMEGYSFGPALSRETDGGYVELDLLVPEFIQRDEDYTGQAWFGPAMALAAGGRAVLVRPAPATYLLVFPAQVLKRGKGK